MFCSCAVRRVFAALCLVPVVTFAPVRCLPAYAQTTKEPKGSYVYMEGKVFDIGGVSDNLYIQGNILGGMESNGEYSSRPTHFWITNTGTKSCFISGEQTGFTVGSAGSEIKPGETLRAGLAIYRPKDKPITSINITLKAWIPAKPQPEKLNLVQRRKLTDAQLLFENSLQQYEAMKDHLQSGRIAWGQLPDTARDNALRQQLDDIAATRQRAIRRMGKFMDGYKHGDLSDLDAILPDLEAVNNKIANSVAALQTLLGASLQQPHEQAIDRSGNSALFRDVLGKESALKCFNNGELPGRTHTRIDLLPNHILRFTRWLKVNNSVLDHPRFDFPLASIDVNRVTVSDSFKEGNDRVARGIIFPAYFEGYTIRIAFSPPVKISNGLDIPFVDLAIQAPSSSPQQLQASLISFIKEELGAPPKPTMAPKLLQDLQDASNGLVQQAGSLPKQADSVSSLNMVPSAVRNQYAQMMNGMEGKNMEAASKSLAPDYFFKDTQGTILTLSNWKAAQTEQLKAFPRLHMVVRVEAQEAKGNDLVVTATRSFINVGGEGTNSRLEQKVKETWTQTGGQYHLQSTEVLTPGGTTGVSSKLPVGPITAFRFNYTLDPNFPARLWKFDGKQWVETDAHGKTRIYPSTERTEVNGIAGTAAVTEDKTFRVFIPDTSSGSKTLYIKQDEGEWQRFSEMEDIQTARGGQEIASDPESYARQGTTFYQQKQYANAEGAFLRATELDPDNPSYQKSLGIALAGQGAKEKQEQAIGALNKAFRLRPSLATADGGTAYLGLAYEKLGRVTDGLNTFRELLGRDPENIELHYWMAYLSYRNGNYVEAERGFRKYIIKGNPKLGRGWLIACLRSQGKNEAADEQQKELDALISKP